MQVTTTTSCNVLSKYASEVHNENSIMSVYSTSLLCNVLQQRRVRDTELRSVTF